MKTMSVETCSAPVMWKIILNLKNINFKILAQVYMCDGD
jgi:hypothetical protein